MKFDNLNRKMQHVKNTWSNFFNEKGYIENSKNIEKIRLERLLDENFLEAMKSMADCKQEEKYIETMAEDVKSKIVIQQIEN